MATAHKLAVIIHQMLTKYKPYQSYSKPENDHQARERKLKEINKFINQFKISPEEVAFLSLTNSGL
jgi:hypothetical protein